MKRTIEIAAGVGNCRCPYCGRVLTVLVKDTGVITSGGCRHFKGAEQAGDLVTALYRGMTEEAA